MALLQTMKALVNQRLSAAAEDIFGIIERILTEYQEEASHYKQGIGHQQRLLDTQRAGWFKNKTKTNNGFNVNLLLMMQKRKTLTWFNSKYFVCSVWSAFIGQQ